MGSIALCMIVKDEPADRLAMLVEYMRPVVSQVVIADTGSEKNETELYRTWGVTALDHPFAGSFADARNSTLSLVNEDIEWILHLDADELPSLGMIAHLNEVKASPKRRPLAWQYFTVNFWAGERGPEMPYHWHCRLFRKKHGRWYLPVHEGVSLDGRTEAQSMESGVMIHAPRDAYLIHSKPQMHMDRANTLYTQLGSGPMP